MDFYSYVLIKIIFYKASCHEYLQLKELSYVLHIAANGDLTIGGVDEQDEGDYSCVASNAAGNDSVDVHLTVGGRCSIKYLYAENVFIRFDVGHTDTANNFINLFFV